MFSVILLTQKRRRLSEAAAESHPFFETHLRYVNREKQEAASPRTRSLEHDALIYIRESDRSAVLNRVEPCSNQRYPRPHIDRYRARRRAIYTFPSLPFSFPFRPRRSAFARTDSCPLCNLYQPLF